VTNGDRAKALDALADKARGLGLGMFALACRLSADTLASLRDDPFEDPDREASRCALLADIRTRLEARLHEAVAAEEHARKLKATAEEALRIMRREG
jgi:hypothetical protein